MASTMMLIQDPSRALIFCFFWIIIQLKIWDWDIEGEESKIIWLGDTETQEAREIGDIVYCFAGVG